MASVPMGLTATLTPAKARKAPTPHLGTLEPPDEPRRPLVREECLQGPRPCPWLSCRYHMFEVLARKSGKTSIKQIARWDEDRIAELVESLPATCCLDLVAQGRELTLQETGLVLNLTRERVRQIQQMGEEQLQAVGRDWNVDILALLRWA